MKIAAGVLYFAIAVGAQKLFSLIHEMGHFTAAKVLFRGPVSVHISMFNSHTSYEDQQMTLLGQKISRKYSNIIVSVAGPIFELFAASLSLTTSVALYRSHQVIGNCLKFGSLLSFLNCASYALSAYFESITNLQHDFVMLKSFGISPLSITVGIVSLPIICMRLAPTSTRILSHAMHLSHLS